jgi:hypothetical protein
MALGILTSYTVHMIHNIVHKLKLLYTKYQIFLCYVLDGPMQVQARS